MPTPKTDLLKVARNFIRAIEKGKTGDELDKFYHKDIEHITYPNALTKNLTKRNLEELKEASERGKTILSKQTYEIIRSYAAGRTVVLEARWTGTLKTAVGQLPAGGQMTAHFAQFFEFRNGKIIRQRNYDCFDAF
ncbi:MAG TPA: nuclear transport factor 2 family protein [Cyclobacteriaceae bacterium]|nr:nuclear transport factor 2 family protein [Cyclobacteriaceae bacterium]